MIQRLIETKRDGGELTEGQWRDILTGFADDRVPAYQVSALLMAIRFNDLTANELDAITDCMISSGGTFEFPAGSPVLDKHSTGGVGDKVSIILAPLVAACGIRVPMMSGRGLGHTGGTLDKLEAIPGFRTDLSMRDTIRQVDEIGCAMFGQTGEIAPVDRKLYALRDVTATVAIPPLIAASIMSKKLAEGLTGLVLDVKQGSGAFMPEAEDGKYLARLMCGLGQQRGCPTVALMTAMNQPLGRACGNALETEEALLALGGDGPDDLLEVTLALGAEMLVLAGESDSHDSARQQLQSRLDDGRALEVFERVVVAQGGNPNIVSDPSGLPQASLHEVVTAETSGVVERMDTRALGWAIVEMGGGRTRVEDDIDPTAGFSITISIGDGIEPGQPLASVFASTSEALETGVRAIREAVAVGEGPPDYLPLVGERITA